MIYLIFMSQIVLYFPYVTPVLLFYIDVVLTLSNSVHTINALESVVYEMVSMLSRPKCVKTHFKYKSGYVIEIYLI